MKFNEFFALASNELALLPTPLLLRFFSPVAPLSVVDLLGLSLTLRLSPPPASSFVFGDEAMSLLLEEGKSVVERVRTGEPCVVELETGPPSFGGDPEVPNILFSKPPWPEKLLLLAPASLLNLSRGSL